MSGWMEDSTAAQVARRSSEIGLPKDGAWRQQGHMILMVDKPQSPIPQQPVVSSRPGLAAGTGRSKSIHCCN